MAVAALLLFSTVQSNVAFGDDTENGGNDAVEQLSIEGAELFQAGQYLKALEKYKEAYAIDKIPNLIYNMARCYEELGEIDKAKDHLTQFLSEPDTSAQDRQTAVNRLKALEERQRQSEVAPERETDAADKPDLSDDKDASAANAPDIPDTTDGTAASNEDSDSPIWPVMQWTTLTLGTAAVAGGTVLFFLGNTDHQAVEDAQKDDPVPPDTITRAEAKGLIEDGDKKKLFGYIAWGAGGALLLVSGALFLFQPEESEETHASFSLAPLPEGGGALIWQTRF